MARCQYSTTQLNGQAAGYTELEVAGLENLATPFASMEEVHKMADLRLRMQAEQDKKTQESVEPP